jgi:hypothetical protein
MDTAVERGRVYRSGAAVDPWCADGGRGEPPLALGIDSQYCITALGTLPPQPLSACAPGASPANATATANTTSGEIRLQIRIGIAARC